MDCAMELCDEIYVIISRECLYWFDWFIDTYTYMPTTSGYSINTGTVASPTVAELDTIFQQTTTAITHTVPNTSLTGYYVGAPTATDVSDMAFRYIFLTDVSNQEKYPKNTNYTVSRAGDFKDKDFKDIFQYGAYTSAITVANVASYDASNAAIDICGTYFYADVSGTSANAPTVSSFFTTKPYRYSLSGLSPNTTYSYIVRPRNGFNTVGTMKTFSVMTKPSITSFAVDTVCTDGVTFNKIKFTFAGSFSKAYIYSNDVKSTVINSTDTSKTINITINASNISVCKIVPFNTAEDVSGTSMTLTLTHKTSTTFTESQVITSIPYIYGFTYTLVGGGGSGGSGGSRGGGNVVDRGGDGGGGGGGGYVMDETIYFIGRVGSILVNITVGSGGPGPGGCGKTQDGNGGNSGGSTIFETFMPNQAIKTVTGGGGGGAGKNTGDRGTNGGTGTPPASIQSSRGVVVDNVTYGTGSGGTNGVFHNQNSSQPDPGGVGYAKYVYYYYTVA